MQFEKRFKLGIREGRITQSFRAWKRPQAKTGGRYRVHPIGMIQVDTIEHCRRAAISSADARREVFESTDALFDYLDQKTDQKSDLKSDQKSDQKSERRSDASQLYRVVFRYAGSGEDERPDTSLVDATDLGALRARLMRMDRLSSRGTWTRQTLDLIEALPATRAADLASRIRLETQVFKTNVRKLKKLGLTLSLETGYELSARGRQLLRNYATWS